MKKTLLIFLLSASILFAYDTTDTQINMKDTILTKSVSDGFFSFNLWHTIIAVVIGSILTWIGVYFANRHNRKLANEQIQHQLKMKQAEIDVATKRKLIDDLIYTCKNIFSIIFKMKKTTIDIKTNQCQVNELNSKVEKNLDNVNNKAEITYNNELLKLSKLYNNRLHDANSNIYDISQDFFYNASLVKLYLPMNHTSYNELDTMSNKLITSFMDYRKIYGADIEELEGLKEEKTKLEKILFADSEIFLRKLQDIIDIEREEISKILVKT